ncbi:YqaA family protein [uncultured Shewanella sp.]|uniref:YqaA family protein n=1 Tax=uncultured Shewanella sp. TaxID=173975 RepID=UPI00261DDA28|nr:YqaA family protein [uncultured Shewanella sp.]
MAELWLMFSAAFLAATLLPGGSEILLIAMLNEHQVSWEALVAVATIGNTLGAITSYYLGYLGRFAITPEEMSKGKYKYGINLIQGYGYWALLLAWVPIIGDILCLFAGWMRVAFFQAAIMIFIGKLVRYFAIVILVWYW